MDRISGEEVVGISYCSVFGKEGDSVVGIMRWVV
jgi:hypothetical protein